MPTEEQIIAERMTSQNVEISTDDENDFMPVGENKEPANMIDLTKPDTKEEVVEKEVVEDTEKKEEVVIEDTKKEEIVEDTNKDIVEDTKKEEIVSQKSLDDYISEKFEGKYKTFDEYETSLTPKEAEPLKYANETVQRINELAEAGINITPELLALQGKNFKDMTDPEKLIKEDMILSGKYEGWTEREIQLDLDDKYRRSEWLDEDGEKTDVGILNEKRFIRDSLEAKANLIKTQEERTIIKEVDPQIEKDRQTAYKAQMDQWNGMVDTFEKSTSKINTVIDEKLKESFDYEPSTEELSKASKIMKDLGSDPLALFKELHSKEDGSMDNQAIYTTIVKLLSGEKRYKIALDNAKAAGAEKEVRDLNNTNYTKDAKAPEKEGMTLGQAIADAEGIPRRKK